MYCTIEGNGATSFSNVAKAGPNCEIVSLPPPPPPWNLKQWHEQVKYRLLTMIFYFKWIQAKRKSASSFLTNLG